MDIYIYILYMYIYIYIYMYIYIYVLDVYMYFIYSVIAQLNPVSVQLFSAFRQGKSCTSR